MFIGTVVAGAVVWTSGGAKMRGALIRDVLAYAAAVAAVLAILASGQVLWMVTKSSSGLNLLANLNFSTLASAGT